MKEKHLSKEKKEVSQPFDGMEAAPARGADSLPTISLPKGGGAIRGIGEKFTVNPVTGTGSMTLPIANSPGRSGFVPQLSLSYDSGSGNGPFGLGWGLSLPTITRKTDKGLPQYRDSEESDEFILSGSEDLVPEYEKDAAGAWLIKDGKRVIRDKPRTVNGITYAVRRYRPRIEGLFARIERWINQTNSADTFWRSISKDNITTWYGRTEKSRIYDPEDPARIFSWLICQSYDDKGNAIVYEYENENSAGVTASQIHEKNRTDLSRQANRYLKRIQYGNLKSNRDGNWQATDPALLKEWMFEVVFDYLNIIKENNEQQGQHFSQLPPDSQGRLLCEASSEILSPWGVRKDPFSQYRAGFDVRTYRLCHRILMFHHFEAELSVPDYLVRATEFTYKQSPIGSFVRSVVQSGFVRQPNGQFLKKSLPSLEFEYSQAAIDGTIREISAENLENLPVGLDGSAYQWVDLDGEGISGILAEQGGAWFYKRNLSPANIVKSGNREQAEAAFAPLETVRLRPNSALASGQAQLLDLAGDGQLDVVSFEEPMRGFYERTENEEWETFRPFLAIPSINFKDPNLEFVDLDGDGHADILITENEAITWYPSLAENGFGKGKRVPQPFDEDKGPRLIFADGTQSVYLADLSGDGLTDLVRIRNGEVCYWPNVGYGKFGAKVTMDNSPWFDAPDQFDQKRIRLADIDGSGTTDIIYLKSGLIAVYRNECGNSWSEPEYLTNFPHIDNLSSVMAVDLLGNGTVCLVWSSPLPGEARRPMRYIRLLPEKPHLLTRTTNNLGAETQVHYAPSTKFHLEDKKQGKPWITRLPFPVHVVERVETFDRLSRNRFVTRYAYHHGYFDGEEREFRGFGMVEQWDTESFSIFEADGIVDDAQNLDKASHVPPVLTKTWFHTGVCLGRDKVSNFFAGLIDSNDVGEYFREPGLDDDQAKKLLLEDTVLPDGLTAEEEREACRALKGSMLRQEVYALDGSEKEKYPYTVTEQNFSVRYLQPMGDNRHGVFFTHPNEAINYHYERNPADPRTSHALTLKVDDYGNVLRSIAVGYPRANVPERQPEQNETHVTLTLARFADQGDQPDWYRVGVPFETRTYEVVKPPTAAQRFTWDEVNKLVTALVPFNRNDPPLANTIPYEQWDWRKKWNPQNEPGGLINDVPAHTRLRIIEHVRTLYRKDDLTALLPLGAVEPLALPGESYTLAFTPSLLADVFKRKQAGQPDEDLLPANPAPLLEGMGADQGGYVAVDGNWWIPTGRVFFDPAADVANPADTAAQELNTARLHFYLPRKFADPFDHCTPVNYDEHDLLVTRTTDALGNTVTAANDYRVLQPRLLMDPNGNRTAAVFDALGMVVGTAVMGKITENKGDLPDNTFKADLTNQEVAAFFNDPKGKAASLLGKATTRIIYDLGMFKSSGRPAYAATLARETHFHDPLPAGGLKIQVNISYSDGFGREIQKKIQAEPGKVEAEDEAGNISVVDTTPNLRWVGSGWTIFNNKGNPVRQYEPFFSTQHHFQFGKKVGVSPILFYDPLDRVIATLHPNHTYEKVAFDPWQQTNWDVNDTVTSDPRTDPNVKGFFVKPDGAPRLPEHDFLPTWHALRLDPAHTAEANLRWPDPDTRAAEKEAAKKAAVHGRTPAVSYFDSLGRAFLTAAHNRFERKKPDDTIEIVDEKYTTRIVFDIEGNQRQVIDAKGRTVMRYDFHIAGPEEKKEDDAGHCIHQASMDAGERWMLHDVMGNPIRTWDSRRFIRRLTYDELRRPTGLYVSENDMERLAEQTVYGEAQGDAANHRTRVYQVRDGAGIATSMAYDFKGNVLESKRELLPVAVSKQGVNWLQNPAAGDGSFASGTAYDALNRPTAVTSPDGSVYRPVFNEANLLDKVEVNLRGAAATPFVTDIAYNAKGQRESIAYGNGARTSYEYDPFTLRLLNLKTTRPPGPNGLASQLFAKPGVVQDLRYTYDPAGNITCIKDASLKTVFHNNRQVDPECEYTYDAIYRLIEAKGREHIGQTAHDANPTKASRRDHPFAGLPEFIAHPNDADKLRNFTETYEYDEVGNFKVMKHTADNGGWTRRYDYEEDSLIGPGMKSNRLTRTRLGNGFNHIETYTYADAQGNDVQGCMTAINGMKLAWDCEDQLQRVDLGGGGTAHYIYDAGGQRVRKVIESQSGVRREERIYLGGFEVYREYNGGGTTISLERETLHVMDDKQRIALVETQTKKNAIPVNEPAPLQRYQLGNHLGSASLELAEDGALISYEEFHPYGTTALQAGRSAAELSLKRYRYTGKERDEETGLNYHSARYYAPWLGRWTSADPQILIDGLNPFIYVRNNTICYIDPNGTKGYLSSGVQEGYFYRNQEELWRITLDKTNKIIDRTAAGLYFIVNTPMVLGEESIRGVLNVPHGVYKAIQFFKEAHKLSQEFQTYNTQAKQIISLIKELPEDSVQQRFNLIKQLAATVQLLENYGLASINAVNMGFATFTLEGVLPLIPFTSKVSKYISSTNIKSTSTNIKSIGYRVTRWREKNACVFDTAAGESPIPLTPYKVAYETGFTLGPVKRELIAEAIFKGIGLSGPKKVVNSLAEVKSFMHTFERGSRFAILYQCPRGGHCIAGRTGRFKYFIDHQEILKRPHLTPPRALKGTQYYIINLLGEVTK